MSREHTPRPGAQWEQQKTVREVVVPDGPWGGPTTFRPWTDDGGQPAEPRLNRRQRRDQQHANRQKGQHR